MTIDGLIGQITIKVDELRAAATDLRGTLERGYRVQLPAVFTTLQRGAQVGGPLAVNEWAGLQNIYHRCLETATGALYNIDMGTRGVAEAAQQLTARYDSADALAQATTADVDALLPPPQPALSPDESAESQR